MRNINVKLSELKIDSNNYIYGFTKQTILGDEYLIFSLYGSGILETMLLEGDFTGKSDYKNFEKEINNTFDIKILLNK